MIYLAAPFWHEDEIIRQSRIDALSAFHAHLVNQEPRSFFFNPLTNSLGCDAPEDYWRAHGIHMLKSAQSMYVLCLDGWQQSKGVKGEIDQCYIEKLSIHYFDPATFKEWDI